MNEEYMRVNQQRWDEMVGVHEFPFCGWQYFADMETGEDGWCRFKDEKKREKVPMMFSLKATKNK